MFWWACLLSAPPVAAAVAAMGYAMPVIDPLRDLGRLLLWSCVEEVVFRGVIQRALQRSSWVAIDARGALRRSVAGVSLANLLTSVLFALAHLWSRPLAVAIGVLPVSLVLGASLDRSGRLWVPIALHGYFNVTLYAASAWLSR